MRSRTLDALGAVLRGSRRIGLGGALARVARAVDSPFVTAGRPLLRATAGDEIELRGFLRHRSFLAAYAADEAEVYYRQVLESLLEPGATFVDGGAHLGLYSIVAARRVAPQGEVLAFEPDSYNLRALRVNLRLNGTEHVEVRQQALGAEPGVDAFFEAYAAGSSSAHPRPGYPALRRTTVETTTLDAALAGRTLSRLVVKLDLEGAEPSALAGMRACATRAESIDVLVEVNAEALEDAGSSSGELVERVAELGLVPFLIDEARAELVPFEVAPHVEIYNLLCRGA
jgi:FkbM family methyltransferase